MIEFDYSFNFKHLKIENENLKRKIKLETMISDFLNDENKQLKRQLLVEQTIAECMAKLRRKGK